MARVTYRNAALIHMQELTRMGWTWSSPTLKVPWVRDPVSELKVYFKSQSVWVGWGPPAHSLNVDIRHVTTPELVEHVRHYAAWAQSRR